MTATFSAAQFLGLIFTALMAWGGSMWGLWLLATRDSRLALDEIAKLRAELPREYVMREDWIRMVTIFDAKLDRAIETFRQGPGGGR